MFTWLSPQFGESPSGEHLELISKSPNYGKKGFENLISTYMAGFGEMLGKLPQMLNRKGREPNTPLPTRFESLSPVISEDVTITWFGHSAFLIESGDKRILIDPMLGEVAAPVAFGAYRFPNKQPIPIDELTDIDVILISHDHYDHLDYPSIKRLKENTKHFVVPLGVGSHLQSWKVAKDDITELDWWESASIDSLRFTAAPARHFSGRGITDRDATLWASWVLEIGGKKLFFSGDSGYGPHFKAIGERFGEIDFAMMECGQYNESWAMLHMMPEETVQAGIDVNAKIIMPIHWGGFNLALHHWTEPIDRFIKKAQEMNVNYAHPIIGQEFTIDGEIPKEEWWTWVE